MGQIAQPLNASDGLADGWNRRFYYLRLSVTDACNFSCTYCLPQGYKRVSGQPLPLTVDECRRLVAAFAALGLRKVRLTGGEPSVRRDLSQIIEAVASTPGVAKVAVSTNGASLDRDLASWVAAGMTALNVSVDSLNPSTFASITGSNRLSLVLKGIDEALSLGVSSVKLNAVLFRESVDAELPRFLNYLKSRPVTLRWIELMRTGDNQEYFRGHHLSAASLVGRLKDEGWREQERALDDGPAREFVHPDYVGKMGVIAPYSKDFCTTCNRLRVSSRGDLRLCLFGEGGIPLRSLLQEEGQKEELIDALRSAVAWKPARHLLHEANPGSTRKLAEIGG